MCFEYDDYPEFTDYRIVVARKTHRCAACRETIAKGETCEVHSGKFEGSFYRDYLCRRCCYDTVRVVEHELAHGCQWHEAWPSFGDLVDYLIDSGMGQTPLGAVPETFKVGDQPKQPVNGICRGVNWRHVG